MKVKAPSNFRMADSKCGTMVERKKAQEFEIDETKEAELLRDLIMMPRVTVIDRTFVPDRGEYIGVRQIVYQNDDGFPRRIDPNGKVLHQLVKIRELLYVDHFWF